MNFITLTIFPELFERFREHGIIRRAIERKKISVSTVNIRDFAEGKHKVTDDRPYGGGCGMVMKPEPLAKALKSVKNNHPEAKIIMLTPQGRPFSNHIARELTAEQNLVFICGRYEGIDERINDLIDDELSIGDYVMTGGELAAMVITDSVTRLIPGVLGGENSSVKDSFENGLIEHAHYTRPEIFEGEKVPDVLLSGNHKEIDKWRFESSLIRTFLKRPDLLMKRSLSEGEIDILKKWCNEIEKIIQAQSLCGAGPLSGDK